VRTHVVIDSVGPATWDRSIGALESGGRLAVCGGTSGTGVQLNLPRLFFKQIEIIGSTMGSYSEFGDVTRLVAQGLPVSIDATFGLDDYPKALDRLEAAAQLGKLVLSHR
jgi:NADPH:quinone reductase-like Zn-dependent oxidoreductase